MSFYRNYLLRPIIPLALILLSCLFLATHGRLAAQTATGQITGTVFDPTGAIIPGASVRIFGAETGDLVRQMTTNEAGIFSAPLLKPGLYNIEVEAQGFKKYVQTNLRLQVDQVLNLRVVLEPGIITEQVTVEAAAVQLEETTHSLGQVVDETTMLKLPLNGRNYLDLGNLVAGTVPNSRSRDRTFSAFGNRGNQNAYLLDGMRNVNYLRGLDNRQRDAMRPSLEAIEEFKVMTSNFSAEYGAAAGVIVNVATKRGTNEFHGSVFEFTR